MIVMRLCGDAFGNRLIFDGQYLKDFDFEAGNGRGDAVMTKDISQAKCFADMAEAVAFWKTSPKCHPMRPDGRPNRPLTATNWSFEHV